MVAWPLGLWCHSRSRPSKRLRLLSLRKPWSEEKPRSSPGPDNPFRGTFLSHGGNSRTNLSQVFKFWNTYMIIYLEMKLKSERQVHWYKPSKYGLKVRFYLLNDLVFESSLCVVPSGAERHTRPTPTVPPLPRWRCWRNCAVQLSWASSITWGVESSTCGITLVLKTFWTWNTGDLQVSVAQPLLQDSWTWSILSGQSGKGPQS